MRVGIGTATAPPAGAQSAQQNTIDPQQSVDSAPEKPGAAPMFISPVIHVDLSGLPITLFRDVDDGEVRFQIPSEEAVTKYRKAEVGNHSAEHAKVKSVSRPENDEDGAKQVPLNGKSLEQDSERDEVEQ